MYNAITPHEKILRNIDKSLNFKEEFADVFPELIPKTAAHAARVSSRPILNKNFTNRY
ncbi:hypothetical protein FACS189425_05750 [Clostridia bacterium]|nr:hypothetical protein FACS189425_05750 [Clostridia bacterium]